VTEEYDLNVYITHFVPPKPTLLNFIKSFFIPRLNYSYIRSWARLLKYGTRGNQPWKKDIMTRSRRIDQINRMLYLARLLQSLSSLRVKNLNINIVTNSKEAPQEILSLGFHAKLNFYVFSQYKKMNQLHNSPWTEDDPTSPWNLVWEHKDLLKKDFSLGNRNSLYLYIENDMLFTQQNLEYWILNRSELDKYGLIPSFIRVEYSLEDNSWVAIDQFKCEQIDPNNCPGVNIRERRFIQLPNTYSAMYILDMQLLQEYLNSKAFHRDTSRDLIWWDLGARASMGVQFLNVPKDFTSRHVIELTRDKISQGALIHHLPNLYTRKLQDSENYSSIENLFKLNE
jgi:hypothetical protein